MDSQFKKLLNGGKWAESAPDNKDPDDTSVTPTITRTQGYPVSFSSQDDGNLPDRRRINQIFRELSGAAFEVRYGVSAYDSEVMYPIGCVTRIDSRLWVSVKVHPSNTGESPTAAGQTTWKAVSGAIKDPAAPYSAAFDNSVPNTMKVDWLHGQDGGERIVEHEIEWRLVGGSENWSPANPVSTPYSNYRIDQLKSGDQVQVRIRSKSNDNRWSPYFISTPSTANDAPSIVKGNVPGGGAALGLTAEAKNGAVATDWIEPPSGGFPILRYRVQWRTDSGTFSSSNEKTTSASTTEYEVPGLVNETTYHFRVRAENSQGFGEWSNVARATPRADIRPLSQPILSIPQVTATGNSYTANAQWSPHPTNPTATPTSAIWETRTGTSGPYRRHSHTGLNGFSQSGLNANTTYQVRFSLVTSVGTTSPSSPATINRRAPSRPSPPTITAARSFNFAGERIVHSVTVNWRKPTNDGGSPIYGYRVRVTVGGVTNSQTVVGQNRTQATLRTGRVPGADRVFVQVATQTESTTSDYASYQFTAQFINA